jgi:hypothetical protein
MTYAKNQDLDRDEEDVVRHEAAAAEHEQDCDWGDAAVDVADRDG